jgi:hypothetical protein
MAYKGRRGQVGWGDAAEGHRLWGVTHGGRATLSAKES